MARSFIAALNEYEGIASAVVLAPPMTLAAWVQGPSGTMLSVDASSALEFGTFVVQWLATTVVVLDNGLTSGLVQPTIQGFGGRRMHLAGVFTSTSLRSAVLNGQVIGSDTTAVTHTQPMDQTSIGVLRATGSLNTPATGQIAYPAIWNVALTIPELQALAQGADPITIRRQSLVETWDDFGHGRVDARQSMTTVLGRPVSSKVLRQDLDGLRANRTYGTRRVLRVG